MRSAENIEKLVKNLDLGIDTNAQVDQKILSELLDAQKQSMKQQSAYALPNIRRFIMKSPITKLAAIALIVVVVILSINILDKSASTAYAIEQTIQASHTVRYLYVKGFAPSQNEPIEIWVEFKESGQLKNMRVRKPAWMDPDEGMTEIVWKNNKTQIWSRKKNVLTTTTDKNLSTWILNLVEQFDPKLAMGRLEQEKKQGKMEVKIEQPGNNISPIIITATSIGENNSPFQRMVLHIDQVTKLVNLVELYQIQDGEYQNLVTFEYHDYNQRIEPEFFSLNQINPNMTHENIIK